MKKNYILDTNVFIYEPECLSMFEDNDIFISPVTLKEITHLKNKDGETGYSARKAKRALEKLRSADHNLSDGLPLGDGLGKLFVVTGTNFADFPSALRQSGKPTNDDYILAAASYLTEHSSREVILVTDDVDMGFLADLIGIRTEPFKHNRVAKGEHQYKGRAIYAVSDYIVDSFYRNGYLDDLDGWNLVPNEFVVFHDVGNPSHSAIGRFDGRAIVPLKNLRDENKEDIHPFDAIPRNNGQRFMQEALLASPDEAPLVIIKGPAGTAKTFMSLACGLELTLNRHEYKRILITRANVEMDNTYGFLPGTEEEKVAPMMRPFLDNLEALMHTERTKKDGVTCPTAVEELFSDGIIKAEAMQYMRGRSISNTFVIIDEAQNCTPNQILSIVSRIGEGSKIVLLGDPEQIDNRFLDRENNGLVFASERMKGCPLCWQITAEEQECVRSKLAAEAAKLLTAR